MTNSDGASRSKCFLDKTDSYIWKTKVEYGSALSGYIAFGNKYSKRDCFRQLQEFIASETTAKICALFGLRRTGKTVLLYQLMAILDTDTTAYIKLSRRDDMLDLDHDLMQLMHLGFKTVLIDEITYAKDFASDSNLLADHYAIHGMKIIVAGTDSLGFLLAAKHALYDRIILVHTTYISFNEHTRLLHSDLDTYVQLGGTLLSEGEVPFNNIADSTEYMNSAIVRNIQHAFEVLDSDPDFYTFLKKVYYDDQLTNLVNRILDDTKHRFVERILNKQFKSSDIGALAHKVRSLIKQEDQGAQNIFDFLMNNRETILTQYSECLNIEDGYIFSSTALVELKNYLLSLDVLSSYRTVEEDYSEDIQYIFTQPGMQYSQATALVEICESIPDFKKLSVDEAQTVRQFLLNNVLGHILEDIVINHVQRALFDSDVFQFRFDGGEFDMIVLDHSNRTMRIYEIKHSSEAVAAQAKHFCNKDILAQLENHYYPIVEKCVLYMGKTDIKYVAYDEVDSEYIFTVQDLADAEVGYKNISEFLCHLEK